MLELLKLKLNNLNKSTLNNKGDYVGASRHYPPASQEWSNSIYAFNKNTLRLLPAVDNLVIRLIRSYFYMFNRKLEKKIKAPRIRIWRRRLTTRKILVSKPQVKHTSGKVIITLYIYNRQYTYYLEKIKKIIMFGSLESKPLIKWIKEYGLSLEVEKILINKFSKYLTKKLKRFNLNILKLKLKKSKIFREINKEKDLWSKTNIIKINNISNYDTDFFNKYFLKSLKKEMLYMYFKQMIFINKFKFRSTYILPLKNFLEKIYGKKVEFNLVTLKNYFLNSDIFTQTITLKTNHRKSRILTVIKTSLRKIKLPHLNKSFIEREPSNFIGVQNAIVKNIILSKDKKVNYLNNIYRNDYLNIILNNNFKSLEEKKTILNFIKYRDIGGVRVEASGRLTKRIKAARAIFKFRYVGTLKNIDSSYKGLSTVILKGNQKPNIQFSKLNSKTRIGAFGIKGWVSGL